jgi:hypothetical protein
MQWEEEIRKLKRGRYSKARSAKAVPQSLLRNQLLPQKANKFQIAGLRSAIFV